MLARNNDKSNTGKLTFEAGNPIAEICKRLPKWQTRRFFMLRNELYSLPSKANRRGMFCYLVKPFAICITVCQQDCLCNFSRFDFLNQLINELVDLCFCKWRVQENFAAPLLPQAVLCNSKRIS